MEDWLLRFWSDKNEDFIFELLVAGVIFLLGVFFKVIYNTVIRGFKSILKGLSSVISTLKKWFRSISQKIEYKRLIKQIENKEKPLTDDFLLGKSPEKNPELKRIFEMMERGEIEEPTMYKLNKMIGTIDFSNLQDKLPNIAPDLPKPFDPTKFLKK